MKIFANKKNNSKGFSLIELVLALSIITVVFFSLINAFPLGLKITNEAKRATTASFLAQEKIEELFVLGYGNLPAGTIEAKNRLSNDPDNFLYHYQRSAEIEHVDGSLNFSASETGMKKITVIVYYQGGLSKNEKSYSIATLISSL